jgi:hypothetical protein
MVAELFYGVISSSNALPYRFPFPRNLFLGEGRAEGVVESFLLQGRLHEEALDPEVIEIPAPCSLRSPAIPLEGVPSPLRGTRTPLHG